MNDDLADPPTTAEFVVDGLAHYLDKCDEGAYPYVEYLFEILHEDDLTLDQMRERAQSYAFGLTRAGVCLHEAIKKVFD